MPAFGRSGAAHARSDRDDAIGIGERQVAQQQSVRQHEHRVVRRDAERQHENCRRGEPAFLDQQAQAEARVAQAVGDDAERPRRSRCISFICSTPPNARRAASLRVFGVGGLDARTRR